MDGFDHYNDGRNHAPRKWGFQNFVPEYTTSTRYGIGQAMRLPGTIGGQGVTLHGGKHGLPSSPSGVVGFAFRKTGNGGFNNSLFLVAIADGENSQIYLRIDNSSRKFFLHNSTGLIATGNTVVQNNQWYFIEVEYYISNSIPANTCRVYLDEILEIDVPVGADTQSQSSNTVKSITLSNIHIVPGDNTDIDDFYFLNKAGTDNRAPLGDVLVRVLYPTGDFQADFLGSDGNSIDNYALVDDTIPDTTGTFITSSTVGARDIYHYGNTPECGVGDIYGVQISTFARKSDFQKAYMRNTARVSGTVYDYDNHRLIWNWSYYVDLIERNPFTNGFWNKESLDAAQFGVKQDELNIL